jgi:uncharacterized damage-inducible protein DinB
MEPTYGTFDIGEQWGRMNDSIVALVDYIPEDKLDWSPREDLWNFRGIVAHIAFVRHNWLGNDVKDGESFEDSELFGAIGSKAGIQQVLHDSWARVGRFLSNQALLERMVERDFLDEPVPGHWVAFHLLEHDIHHRSDIFHYLALLEIEHPDVGTP